MVRVETITIADAIDELVVMQGGETVSRGFHTPEQAGSTPAPAIPLYWPPLRASDAIARRAGKS